MIKNHGKGLFWDIFMTVMCCVNYQKTLQSWSHFKSDQILYIQYGGLVHSVLLIPIVLSGTFNCSIEHNCDVGGISGSLIMIDIDPAQIWIYRFGYMILMSINPWIISQTLKFNSKARFLQKKHQMSTVTR